MSLLMREEFISTRDSIWIHRAPWKMCFFGWLAARVVILKTENLRKRRITCVSWCFMCKGLGEDVDHPQLHCKVAKRLLWRSLICSESNGWYRTHWRRCCKVGLLWGKEKVPRAWNVAPLAIMWVIWKERIGLFVKLPSNLLFLVSFCTPELPVFIEDRISFFEKHILIQVLIFWYTACTRGFPDCK